MMFQEIIFANDHAGYELKQHLIKQLKASSDFNIQDVGTHDTVSTDYPDWIHQGIQQMLLAKGSCGVFICGSGNGVCITANRYPNIRAAIAWQPELASLARRHNDANVLCLPARFITDTDALETVQIFLNTEFEGGRHVARIEKINQTGR